MTSGTPSGGKVGLNLKDIYNLNDIRMKGTIEHLIREGKLKESEIGDYVKKHMKAENFKKKNPDMV